MPLVSLLAEASSVVVLSVISVLPILVTAIPFTFTGRHIPVVEPGIRVTFLRKFPMLSGGTQKISLDGCRYLCRTFQFFDDLLLILFSGIIEVIIIIFHCVSSFLYRNIL